MQAEDQLPRRRTPTPGPEGDFLEAALDSAPQSGLWHEEDDPLFFREPALPTGFPDLIGVFVKQREILFPPERLRLEVKHLQVLHYLCGARSASVSEASGALLWSEQSLEAIVQDLELAELVRRSRRRVRCAALSEVFVAKRIVAVEAKLDKWEIALRQAVANTWFASHSFILLPEGRWSTEVRCAAGRFGIGVLTYDGDRPIVRLRAEKRPIPASYGSWLVNEWAVRRAGRPVS